MKSSTKLWFATLATAGILFSFTGCKKDENKANDNPPVKAVAEAVEFSVGDWKKEDVNSLLAFVPADTPMVIATTRQVDLNHPIHKNMQTHVGKITDSFKDIFTGMRDLSEIKGYKSDVKGFQMLFDVTQDYEGLFKDYKASAPDFGLNPEHTDQIIYIDKGVLVSKQTVDDGAKLKGKILATLNSLKDNIDFDELVLEDVKAGDVTWSVFKTQRNIRAEEQTKRGEELKQQLEEAKTKGDTEALRKITDELDSLYLYDENNDFSLKQKLKNQISTIIHFDKNVVTTIYLANIQNLEQYNHVIKTAQNPLDKSALGKIDDATVSLGFVDNVKLFDDLMASFGRDFIVSQLMHNDEENVKQLDSFCIPEVKAIIANVPKINMVTRISGDNTLISESTLVLSDKEILKTIQDLHTPSLDIITDKTIMGGKINIDFTKLLAQAPAIAESLSKKNYQCEPLAKLAKEAQSLPALAAQPQFAMFKTLSGFNAALDKLELDPNNPDAIPTVEAIADITGSTMAITGPIMIAGFAQYSHLQIPALSANGEPKEINLEEIASIPYKINAILSQTDLIAATTNYDIKTIASNERKPGNTFIDYVVRADFVKSIVLPPLSKEIYRGRNADNPEIRPKLDEIMKSITKLLNDLTFSATLTLGTNDEGIVGSATIRF